MLSMWDEATMFVSSFGRYGNGSAANYDRSVYLEVANAGEVFTRDLKGSRSRIHNPRLQICLLGNLFSFKLVTPCLRAYHISRQKEGHYQKNTVFKEI